ncbi:MAG: hypothetical protein E7099_07800 [Mediterranea massiliensis]|nr:hypothetical protein [Mediterranea massiliensis]
MDINKLERIEKYLSKRMSEEETILFEKELQESEDLKRTTQQIAYIIASINKVGLLRDNARIEKIRESVLSDSKRYLLSVAAMLAVILTFAAVSAVPTYKFVIKPILEKVIPIFNSPKSSNPQKREFIMSADTINMLDSLLQKEDTLVEQVDTIPLPIAIIPKVIEKQKPLKNKEKEVIDTMPKQPLVEKVLIDTTSIEIDTNKTVVHIKKEELPLNRIVTFNKLQNFIFSDVQARREGDEVICWFTMTNTVENTKIQMHSARAKDAARKNYAANYCLLNGSSKRITETWEKGKTYLIEINIKGVDEKVTEFEQISFSFQSDGEVLKQRSQSIILKVGKIK